MQRREPTAGSRSQMNAGEVVGVDAELAAGARRAVGVGAVRVTGVVVGPGVLRRRVESGPGEVQADRPTAGVEGLGLEPGEDPQRLCVALEAAARGAELGQRALAVVAERRVPEVVGERRRLHDVGVAPDRAGEVAGHLGHLEGVRQPVAHEVVGLRPDHLGLGGEPAQCRGVHDPGPVALERGALGRPARFGRLVHPARTGVLVVPLRRPHRGDPTARRGRVRRPSRARGRSGWPWSTRGRTCSASPPRSAARSRSAASR